MCLNPWNLHRMNTILKFIHNYTIHPHVCIVNIDPSRISWDLSSNKIQDSRFKSLLTARLGASPYKNNKASLLLSKQACFCHAICHQPWRTSELRRAHSSTAGTMTEIKRDARCCQHDFNIWNSIEISTFLKTLKCNEHHINIVTLETIKCT